MATHVSSRNQLDLVDMPRINGLYFLAGLMAVLMISLVVLDIGVSMTAPEGEIVPGSIHAEGWFEIFQDQPLKGFRDLGILNIINQILGIPLIFALYLLHRDKQPAFAALALIFVLFGGAIYIANNTVMPMYALSQQYAAANDVQQAALRSAGEAMLARGADFTPGAIVGFVLPTFGNILMAFVLLRGNVFHPFTAWTGIIGFISLLIFAVWVTFLPDAFDTAMMLAMVGGIAVLLWNILLSYRFFQLAGQGQSS